jgi:molybdopterin synthase sulfur carrier subunit
VAKILYFATLVDKLGRAAEDVAIPIEVNDVRALLAWLRMRGGNWEQALSDNAVRVTVNKQFVTLETKIDNACEIALVSARPW